MLTSGTGFKDGKKVHPENATWFFTRVAGWYSAVAL
jgi:hypothetical protein